MRSYAKINNVGGTDILKQAYCKRPSREFCTTKKPKIMKTQKVNIYLDPNMSKKLTEMSKKFHVSKSTIVDSLYIFFVAIIPKINTEYLVNSKQTTKTSVKPKLQVWDKEQILNGKTNMILTNLIYVLTYDKFNDYLTPELTQHFKKKFYAHLQQTRESFYNYNEHLRNNVRMSNDPKFMAYMEKLNAKQKNNRRI